MCNISFIFNPSGISAAENTAFKFMLALNSASNGDGTGWLYKAPGGIRFFKDVQKAQDLMALPEIKSFVGLPWVVAHTRKISRGGKSLENTHPFVNGHLLLVHNGTMTFKKKPDGDISDSQHFSAVFENALREGKSVEEALKSGFAEFEDGTYAMLFCWRGELFFLAGKNTVYTCIIGDTVIANTDKDRLKTCAYILQVGNPEIYVSEIIRLEPGLYRISPETGQFLLEESTKDKLFLKEKEISYSWASYKAAKPAGKVTHRRVTIHSGGETALVNFIEALPPEELGALIGDMAAAYSVEELYNMMGETPEAFLQILQTLVPRK